MPANTSTLEKPLTGPSGPFTVQITDNPAHAIRFDAGNVYLENRLLNCAQQTKLLDDYKSAYQFCRRRNYAWRFLSACHDHFNGQLQEIQSMQSDESRIRYLFCHAEANPASKTAEALKIALPIFCLNSNNAPPITTCQLPGNETRSPAAVTPQTKWYGRPPTQSNFLKERAYVGIQKLPEKTVVLRSECHERHVRWMDEAFSGIWKFPSVQKVSWSNFDGRTWQYHLLFDDDCKATIIKKSNPGLFARFNPSDNTVERERAMIESCVRV